MGPALSTVKAVVKENGGARAPAEEEPAIGRGKGGDVAAVKARRPRATLQVSAVGGVGHVAFPVLLQGPPTPK